LTSSSGFYVFTAAAFSSSLFIVVVRRRGAPEREREERERWRSDVARSVHRWHPYHHLCVVVLSLPFLLLLQQRIYKPILLAFVFCTCFAGRLQFSASQLLGHILNSLIFVFGFSERETIVKLVRRGVSGGVCSFFFF
jgi:hypothetical protein